jgi:hypothetical protein
VRLWLLLLTPVIVAPFFSLGLEEHVRHRRARNESAIIATLRRVSDAQKRFRKEDLDRDDTLDYATNLAELGKAGLIDGTLADGVVGRYTFGLSGSTFDWIATAIRGSDDAGTRNFAMATDGVVRFSKEGLPVLHGCPYCDR